MVFIIVCSLCFKGANLDSLKLPKTWNPTKNYMEKNQTFEKIEKLKKIQSMLKLIPNEMMPVNLKDLEEMFGYEL
jgi:hypothetical protein